MGPGAGVEGVQGVTRITWERADSITVALCTTNGSRPGRCQCESAGC